MVHNVFELVVKKSGWFGGRSPRKSVSSNTFLDTHDEEPLTGQFSINQTREERRMLLAESAGDEKKGGEKDEKKSEKKGGEKDEKKSEKKGGEKEEKKGGEEEEGEEEELEIPGYVYVGEIAVVIALSLLFEAGEDDLRDDLKEEGNDVALDIMDATFGELTILGFIGKEVHAGCTSLSFFYHSY
jgi:hypothetical protein